MPLEPRNMQNVLRNPQGDRYAVFVIGRVDGSHEWTLSGEVIQRILDEVSVHGKRDVCLLKTPDEDGWIACLLFNIKISEKVNLSKIIDFLRTGDPDFEDDRSEVMQAVWSAIESTESPERIMSLGRRCLRLLSSWHHLIPEHAGDRAFVNESVHIESRDLSASVTRPFAGMHTVHEDESQFIGATLLGRRTAENYLPALITVNRIFALSRTNLDA